MTTAILAVLLGLSPVAEGKATRYNPGVMETVVENRVRWGQLDLARPHRDYVALASCEYLGDSVLIKVPERGLMGPYLVADCGAQHDQPYLREIGFAVDLSWELAKELGVVDAPLYDVQVFTLGRGERG